MKSITFVVSKGGVGKSLITANVGAALAAKGKKVVLVEGDPNQPLQKILRLKLSSTDPRLEDIVEKDEGIEEAIYPTDFDSLFLIPSDISLQNYFEIDPISFARKLSHVKTEFMLVDVPFPLGKAAFLSLGVCGYFIPILTEDEFLLCVESTIDTLRLGKYLLKSIPLGFVVNRIKTPENFQEELLKDLENIFEIPCISQIQEDHRVSKSYGGVKSKRAFLAYHKLQGCQFISKIDNLATWLLNRQLESEKKNVVQLLQHLLKPLKL